jgi:hypothetical protein
LQCNDNRSRHEAKTMEVYDIFRSRGYKERWFPCLRDQSTHFQAGKRPDGLWIKRDSLLSWKETSSTTTQYVCSWSTCCYALVAIDIFYDPPCFTILIEFQSAQQFMSHVVVCMERQYRSEYFSRISCKLGQNNVAENDDAILSMPYSGLLTSSTMQHDKDSAVAVVCDSSERLLVAVYVLEVVWIFAFVRRALMCYVVEKTT